MYQSNRKCRRHRTFGGYIVGAAAAPSLSSIPFVGWVAAGWVAMFGGNQGADIGGNMAEDLNKNC